MPFESTLGLNVFGKGSTPQERKPPKPNKSHEPHYYVGKRINVEVGQLLVVSCFLWHATALPVPIFGRLFLNDASETDPKLQSEEHWVTAFDYRLHFYLGCNAVDVDDQNLTLPEGETGFTHQTTYESPEVTSFSNDHMFEYSKTVFKEEQIDQR